MKNSLDYYLNKASLFEKENEIHKAEECYLEGLENYPLDFVLTEKLNALRVNFHHILNSKRLKLLLAGGASNPNGFYGRFFRNIADVIYLTPRFGKSSVDFILNTSEIFYNYFDNELSDIWDYLPSGWIPDYIIIINAEVNYYINGLGKSPYPTIATVNDYFYYGRKLNIELKYFDIVLPLSEFFGNKFKKLGCKNILYHKGGCSFGSSPELYPYMKLKKLYDVAFVGKFDFPSYISRDRFLKQLLRLRRKFKIYFGQGEFTEIFNQSKIVLNCANEQKHVNFRALEVIDCGSLLFMEDDNMTIRDFFEDKTDLILYNENNMEELIEYYVAHDAERENIIQNAMEKARNYTYKEIFCSLFDLITKDYSVNAIVPKTLINQQEKVIDSLNIAYYFSIYTEKVYGELVFNYNINNLVNKYEKLLTDKKYEEYRAEIYNNIIVCLCNLIMNLKLENEKDLNDKIKEYCNKLLYLAPDYIIARLNMFLFKACYLNEIDQDEFNTIETLLNDEQNKTIDSWLLIYPPFNEDRYLQGFFRMQWEKVVIDFPEKDDRYYAELRKIAFWMIYSAYGNYKYMNKEYDSALKYYLKAIENIDTDHYLYYQTGKIFFYMSRFDIAIKNFEQSIALRPFHLKSEIYLAKSLFAGEKFNRLIEHCDDCIITNVIDSSCNSFFMYYSLLAYISQQDHFNADRLLKEFIENSEKPETYLNYLPDEVKYYFHKNSDDTVFDFVDAEKFIFLMMLNNPDTNWKEPVLNYITGFTNQDKVSLVISIGNKAWTDTLLNELNNLIVSVNLTHETIPDIVIYDEQLITSEKISIFANINAYIAFELDETDIFLAYAYKKEILFNTDSTSLKNAVA